MGNPVLTRRVVNFIVVCVFFLLIEQLEIMYFSRVENCPLFGRLQRCVRVCLCIFAGVRLRVKASSAVYLAARRGILQ